MHFYNFLIVCLGSALGGGLRYLLALQFPSKVGEVFNGTLLVNIIGSFFVGIAFVLLQKYIGKTPYLLILIGFLGGFTTFSSFSLDAFQLIKDGYIGHALILILISVLASIIALVIGYFIALKLVSNG